MNFRRSRGGDRVAAFIDITPLVDVVFQLILFFALTSSYIQNSRVAPSIPVDLPEASATSTGLELRDFTVVVKADGGIFVGADERVSLEELGVRMRQVAIRSPETLVLIRADQDVPYRFVAAVMGEASTARLRVSAAVRAP